MNNSVFKTLLLLLINGTLFAQPHTPVFPDAEGDALLEKLVNEYYPSDILPFANSRDSLFAIVYARNDSLTGVYTGHKVYLDPTQDPTQAAFMDGSDDGINTEHTWPRANGADDGDPKADMHHLFPTRTPVNASRDNRPYAEIPDNETDSWYYLNNSQSGIPAAHIELYSEKNELYFEPREDHKGNVARAMFYFYTMYKTEADLADPQFFEIQREDLCNWHLEDPVDGLEWERTWQIAEFQGTPNPFVLDCTLPERSFCSDLPIFCTPTAIRESSRPHLFSLNQNEPNPFTDFTTISYQLGQDVHVVLRILDVYGRTLAIMVNEWQAAGSYSIELNGNRLVMPPSGLLYLHMTVYNDQHQWSEIRKMIKL